MNGVHVVEPAKLSNKADLNNFSESHPPGYPFQVGYQENDQKYILYLVAEKDQDRVDWIQSIRTGRFWTKFGDFGSVEKKKKIFFTACLENTSKSERYHWGVWSGKRWTCCRLSNRSDNGCNACSSWSRAALTSLLRQPSTESLVNNNPTRLEEFGEYPVSIEKKTKQKIFCVIARSKLREKRGMVNVGASVVEDDPEKNRPVSCT